MLESDQTWITPPPTPVTLPHGEVHVWRVWLQRSPEELAELSCLLSPEENERKLRFRVAIGQQQYVVARAALRSILAGYLSCTPQCVRFSHGPMGKPYLIHDGPPIHFNVSHSHELGLIAVARDYDVGVDVERLRTFENQLPMAERFFHRREYEALVTVPDDQVSESFFRAWTRKEAFLKAWGNGISYGVDRIEVTLLPGEPPRLLRLDGCEKAAAEWSLVHLNPASGYMGALAARGQPTKIRTLHWKSSP